MSLNSAFEIEIQDLGDTSGEAHLIWVRSRGGTDGDIRSNVKLRHKNELTKAPAPLIVRGVGWGVPELTMTDPYLTGFGRGQSGQYYSKSNNSWKLDADALIISGEGYYLTSDTEAAFAPKVYEGTQTFYASQSNTQYPAGGMRGRLDVIRPVGSNFWPESHSKSGDSAWISYDMSGEADKNIFAYSFEIVAELSGTDAQLPATGQDFKASELLYLTGVNYSGACADSSLILSVTGESCEYDPNFLERIADTKYFCVPNSITGDAELSGYIRTGLLRVAQELSGAGYSANQSDSSQVSTSIESFSYSVYEGLLKYNYPQSGDYISVYPYAYDYTGEYNSLFGVNPPFPAQTVTLRYPEDYSSVDSLVSAINSSLSGSGQTLWNRQYHSSCANDGNLSGLFETGGLMKAVRTSGDYILIQSLRAGAIGKYQISIYEVDRPSGIEQSNKTRLLLPSSVVLQGSTDNSSWNQIGSLQPEWKNAASMRVDLTSTTLDWISGNISYSEVPPTNTTGDILDSGLAPIRTIYSARATANSKCGESLSRDVEFYRVESPFACVNTGLDTDNGDEKDGYLRKSGVAGTGVFASYPASALVYKTGAKHVNTGNYNYYRIVMSGLNSSQNGEFSDVSNVMYVSRVSFFGVKSGEHLLSGQTCIFGADYSGQVAGYTTGVLTGTITGEANESGIFTMNRVRVSGTPQTPVVFQYSQGNPVGLFTGLVSAQKTGTGYYEDVVQGYYYNSGDDCIYFQAPVSGTINGSGNLTGGPYLLVRDEFIQSLSENYQTVSGYEGGVFTGLIPDFSYSASDIPSFYQYSNAATGVVTSGDNGFLDVSSSISLIPTGTVYSNALSGTVEATAAILYNSPASGDSVVVNGVPFIFSAESGSLFFSSKASLAQKISDNTSTSSTGVESGAYVFLRSTSLGESGNSISLSYTGGAGKPSGPSFFTGGRDVHYPLTAAEPFTGYLDSGIYAVQYFQVSGSGYLTGEIKQLDFVRHFSGVWDLTSGATSFRDSGKYSFGKYINSGFETLGYYSGRPDYIPLSITYNNSPYVPTIDIVKLTVTGYDSQTGLSVLISGKAL